MGTQTKIDIVFNYIKEQIEHKQLIEGNRLPSVRALAKQLNFSVSTVVEAYARLQTENFIQAKLGSGYYILGQNQIKLVPNHSFIYDREVDPLWISRQSLQAKNQSIKPGCGWLPSDWMPHECIRRALKKVSKLDQECLTDYATPLGHLGLRQLIAKRKERFDIHVNYSQILLTDSGTQAIDLIFRNALQAGDIILIDDPCYFNFQALIKAHRLQAIAIPFLKNGPDMEKFRQALSFKPKMYLTNSGIHNPTGATLSMQGAFELAQLAVQNDIVIIEDDIFADFEQSPSPRYSALAGFEHVIQIGSFSKTLSASLRTGYIITNHKKIEELIDLKIATNFSSNQLNAELVFQVLMDPSYLKHLEWMKNRLNLLRNDIIQKLENLAITPWIIPKAGIFLWCKLPEDIDAAELSKLCVQENIILAPGHAFSHSTTAHQYMRFNISQFHEQKIWQILEKVLIQLKN